MLREFDYSDDAVETFDELAADNVVGKVFATRGYKLLDHGLFDENDVDYQDAQERQLAAVKDFYSDDDPAPVVDLEDLDEFVKERTEVELDGDVIDALEAIEWSLSPLARLLKAEVINRDGRFVLVY